jgi:rare lipoprotein A
MTRRSVSTARDESTRRRPAGLIALALLALSLPIGGTQATEPFGGPLVDIPLAAEPEPPIEEGVVSWYGPRFHNRPTASGELFDTNDYTMAHRTLPFGTKVRVTNLRNGRSVTVRVNDRGPYAGRRIADLSHAAAARIGMVSRGVARARIEVIEVMADAR